MNNLKVLYMLIIYFAYVVFVPKSHENWYAYSKIRSVIPLQRHSSTEWNKQSMEGLIDIYEAGSTSLHNQMVGPVPPSVTLFLSNL